MTHFVPGWFADEDDLADQLSTKSWPLAGVMEARLRLLESYRSELSLGGRSIDSLKRRAFHERSHWEGPYDRIAEVDGLVDDLPMTIADRVARRREQAHDSLGDWSYSKPSRTAPLTVGSGNARFIPSLESSYGYTSRHGGDGMSMNGVYDPSADILAALASGYGTAQSMMQTAHSQHVKGERHPVQYEGSIPPWVRNEGVGRGGQIGLRSGYLRPIASFDLVMEVWVIRGWISQPASPKVYADYIEIRAGMGNFDVGTAAFSIPPGTSWRQLGGPVPTTETFEATYGGDPFRGPVQVFWDVGPTINQDLAKTGRKLATIGSGTTVVDYAPLYEANAPDTAAHTYVSLGWGYDILAGLPEIPLIYAGGAIGPDVETDLPIDQPVVNEWGSWGGVHRDPLMRDGMRDYAFAHWIFGIGQEYLIASQIPPAVERANWPHGGAVQPNGRPLY